MSFDLFYLNDPVYGLISIPNQLKAIIESPEFQRLKEIKQLGVSSFIFPRAKHNRFEHSIGVAYLCFQTVLTLQKNHPEITDRSILLVCVAGLLHDVSHGPFSHVFDKILEDIDPQEEKFVVHHEIRSQIITERILKRLNYSDSDISIIQYLIDPEKYVGEDVSDLIPGYLTEIVNNRRFRIDCDKLDYLRRDSFYLGISDALPHDGVLELLSRSRIVDGAWSFDIRDQDKIQNMICMRMIFHINFYSNPKVVAVECMVHDIFVKIDEIEDLFKCTSMSNEDDINKYLSLNDKILERILEEKDKKYKDVKEIVRRIYSEDYYTFLGDFINKIDNLD